MPIRSALQLLYSRALRVCVLLWGVTCYLLEPDAAFLAVLVAVILDLGTKLVSLAVRNHGFVAAISSGAISSKKAFLGTLVKLVAYFTLGIMSTQVKYVASLEVAAILSKTIIYGFLFTVEAISILENLIDAGLVHLKPVLSLVESRLNNASPTKPAV